ncbi:MAG: NifB/NifX family molybdenum-iron cluster-binding protein [Ruminococcus sp.]|nr:NifB/NifX family molybdenum-iron cluster-binding protein [Ruminococcus sp.]
MRIAVTYENGNIFQHFGHTAHFKIYDVVDGEIINEQIVNTLGSGHGALAGFLSGNNVNVLICGGIGDGAKMALKDAGIQLYGGVSGNTDEAVKSLISGKLNYNPFVKCSHHEHGHSCGNNSCGEDKHGCGGN